MSVTVPFRTCSYDQYGHPSSCNPTYIRYTDTAGNTQTITINYHVYSFVANAPVVVVDSIVFPDGSAYYFGYHQSACITGYTSAMLGSISLTTGGTITFQDSSQSCTNGTYSIARGTSDGTTTYSSTVNARAPISQHPTQTTTTISRPDGSSEVINFVESQIALGGNPTSSWITLETSHVWKTHSGSTIKSTQKCYNGATGDCTTTAVALPVTQIATTTTLNNGLSSKVVEYRNANGLTTEVDEYDYSASTPTRKTVTSYASLGNNILDHPSSVTVYDSSSNVISQTTYSYDEYSLASSGVSGLAAVSGSRGNQTSVQKRVSASTSISTHTHYDNAGQIVSTTDGNSNPTTFSHDTTTDTYVIKKTYPPVPSGTFFESYTYDPNTGMLTQSKDLNGQPTGYTYDSMLRNTGICYPDGGYTLTSFPSATTNSVSQLTGSGTGCTQGGGIPGGNWLTTTIQYDGYGRVIHSTNPAGNTTDTQYDSMGRVYSVSNPAVREAQVQTASLTTSTTR